MATKLKNNSECEGLIGTRRTLTFCTIPRNTGSLPDIEINRSTLNTCVNLFWSCQKPSSGGSSEMAGRSAASERNRGRIAELTPRTCNSTCRSFEKSRKGQSISTEQARTISSQPYTTVNSIPSSYPSRVALIHVFLFSKDPFVLTPGHFLIGGYFNVHCRGWFQRDIIESFVSLGTQSQRYSWTTMKCSTALAYWCHVQGVKQDV